MAFDPVPWAVGGDADLSPEAARNMLAIATGRAKGIIGTPDLAVTPTPVPSTSVRIATGSGLVQLGGTQAAQQSYSFRAPTATDISVAPTGSGGGRSDLVIARVEDPTVAGAPWQMPSNPRVGPYVFPRIISGVPAGTETLAQAGRAGDSAIVLARIDIPANTGTITAGMIKDLRRMALPRQETQTNMNQNSTTGTLTSDAYIQWPDYRPGNRVPEWATHAQARAWFTGIKAVGPVDGSMRLELWGDNNVNIAYGNETKYDIDAPIVEYGGTPEGSTGGGAQRFNMTLALYAPVHAFRDQFAYFVTAAHRLPNRPDRGDISVDANTTIMFDITFYERPI